MEDGHSPGSIGFEVLMGVFGSLFGHDLLNLFVKFRFVKSLFG